MDEKNSKSSETASQFVWDAFSKKVCNELSFQSHSQACRHVRRYWMGRRATALYRDGLCFKPSLHLKQPHRSSLKPSWKGCRISVICHGAQGSEDTLRDSLKKLKQLCICNFKFMCSCMFGPESCHLSSSFITFSPTFPLLLLLQIILVPVFSHPLTFYALHLQQLYHPTLLL